MKNNAVPGKKAQQYSLHLIFNRRGSVGLVIRADNNLMILFNVKSRKLIGADGDKEQVQAEPSIFIVLQICCTTPVVGRFRDLD